MAENTRHPTDECAHSMPRRTFLQAGGSLVAGAALGLPTSAKARPLPYGDYAAQDAVGLAALIRKREASAAEVLEAAIARAEAVNPAINAIVLKHYNLAREALAKQAPQGPLAGVPWLLKDLGIYLKGTITTGGSAFFRDAVAGFDSTLVERYRRGGLVIFGKTAAPEFGQTATTESRLWGLTRNPWNLGHTSGGSSGGAAAAVAAGIVPAAHASDGGGSIRIPASNCGLFGLKTSRGRNPHGPYATEGWMGLSVQHAITRSVRDSAAILDISQGAEPGSRVVPPVGAANYSAGHREAPPKLRIALWDTHIYGLTVHPDCLEAVQRTAKLCESLGHGVEPAAPQLPVAEMGMAMGALTGTGLLVAIRDREKELGRAVTEADLEPINWRNIQQAAKRSGEEIYRGREALDHVAIVLDEFLARYDLILSPTTAVPPPKLGELSLDQPYEKYMLAAMNASPFTSVFNMGGHPAMSAPLYWNKEGLPIGTQFAGRFGDELTLLRLAAQLEEAAPWASRRPKL
ncbi:MAG: 6-aminohexanoate-cyclic-dimer hydrolase [Steroidobacteraceae bacterium]|nr:6-aminohexanoate-cyclic-dimer hydrolase [Steroidobacteraceae bacterium]